ncbi:amidohydrolase [Pseudomonas brenneri]|uniref:Amidase n=1 Tax=Pseudomonas brenneri TaxID=129817 RepID=A0A5B2UYH9_9PSED|nr:amidase [Pseudomonas brenneri]KAA2231684.1 amidase [Pseudomonas brenneri]TWR79310.1 amidase [Pseudomonas brenneri]GGL38139.1 amidohydrolase [Pseudomonas brenneri]SDU89724.1 aspartyl-tRNA(Asn)/glutamyl-tRNA(Gln) amidotransferase subunit A [Pseudomonas brenneri]
MSLVKPTHTGYFFGLSIVTLAERLRAGNVTSVELTQAALDSIERLNPLLNAFVSVDAPVALALARKADALLAQGQDLGPLHGIPVAVKDNIDTFDYVTTYGSAHFDGFQPDHDALCVQRVREAGAVIIGKTLTHEFAYGPTGDRSLQGAARNPWDARCITGGSSAGSAAAVASGMVPLALGTDTGGSIRIPSALCGTVGFKPSFACVPVEGVFPLSSSLDHVGPIANHVEDARLLFEVLAGRACAPAANAQPLRVGWITSGSFGPVDAEVNRQVYQAAQQLFGDALQETDELQTMAAGMKDTLQTLQRAEAFEVHAERMRDAPHTFDPEVRERLEVSREVKGWQYIRAQASQAQYKAAMARLFERYDLLVSPSVPITATEVNAREVRVGEQDIDVRAAVLSHTSAWNLIGLPSISLPVGHVRGMPVGLQVIGAAGEDDRLLQVMSRLFVRG